MSPISRETLNRASRRASRSGSTVTLVGLVNVQVEHGQVDAKLTALEMALSPPSLEWWLDEKAHRHFQNDIVQRFAYEGDRKSGAWPPLTEATQRIRRDLGYTEDEINRRSNRLLEFVAETYETSVGPDYAMLDVPGHHPPDALTARKLETAQKGSDDNPRGFKPTPPRPVLAEPDNVDVAFLLESLMFHISDMVSGGQLSGIGQVVGGVLGEP
jgi:hypothetical protein